MKTVSAAVVSALMISSAGAVGLGELRVLSALGQPLRAEIELTSVSKEEVGALTAKLASVEAFAQANVDFNPALASLRFDVEQRGDRQVIRITSTQPLNEPFVDLLLELNGPNGRLIREYTFLLDPADLRSTSTAQAMTPVQPPLAPSQAAQQQSRPVARPADSAPRVAAPRPAARPAAEVKKEGPQEYHVRRGDTLAKIASQYRSRGVSLDQMLVALFQANPDAFVGNNMNRLKAGQILSVPSADVAKAVDAAEARTLVAAQVADFNEYRNKLAGRIAASTAQKTAESRQSAGGKITAKVDEQAAPAAEPKDKLKLSNALGAGKDSEGSDKLTEEDRIAQAKAVAEAEARVKELEKNVSELQKLLEVKSLSLAEQQQSSESKVAAAPETASAPAAESGAKPAEQKPETPPTVARNPKTVASHPVKEQGLFDSLFDNPLVLPGIGALLAAIGALGVYRARRQKQDSKTFEDSLISDSTLKANSLFGSTGGQSVDTNNSVFNSSFSPGVSQLNSNEVDPVAEADVYIAYGRDAQAEEILKEALRTQPDRHSVRVKLLEIYSNRKDLRAFDALATELYGLTQGEGEEWAQAAALGAALDPNNPLYGNGKQGSDEAGLVAPTEPLQDDGLATLLSTTQVDIDARPSGTADESPSVPVEESKEVSNEIEFNLGDIGTTTTASVVQEELPPEAAANLASIDFNFLDEAKTEQPEAVQEAQAPEVPSIGDFDIMPPDTPAAEIPVVENSASEIPVPGTPAEEAATDTSSFAIEQPVEASSEAKPADPLDFDLSGISLELEPKQTDAQPDISLDNPDLQFDLNDDSLSSVSAEMATKLDLAIAYQEIGDKEGARELLDEVVKGGTPEQSERAKSLLMELA